MIQEAIVRTISEEEAKKIRQELELRIQDEANKPFIVAIMGQTGVGKSSLVNALFNTNLETDPLRPCTKEIKCVVAQTEAGHQLWFYDLPGIGESEQTDSEYIDKYRKTLIDSDVVVWAILADSRSVTLDFKALSEVLGVKQEQRTQLISKIIFVLTKADLLTPDPWILAISEKTNSGYFYPRPQGKTEQLLEEKSSYYQNLFLSICTNSIQSEILFKLPVIPCSARFRYNLTKVMLAIVEKMQEEVVLRFDKVYRNNSLNKLIPLKARELRNFDILDLDKKVQ